MRRFWLVDDSEKFFERLARNGWTEIRSGIFMKRFGEGEERYVSAKVKAIHDGYSNVCHRVEVEVREMCVVPVAEIEARSLTPAHFPKLIPSAGGTVAANANIGSRPTNT